MSISRKKSDFPAEQDTSESCTAFCGLSSFEFSKCPDLFQISFERDLARGDGNLLSVTENVASNTLSCLAHPQSSFPYVLSTYCMMLKTYSHWNWSAALLRLRAVVCVFLAPALRSGSLLPVNITGNKDRKSEETVKNFRSGRESLDRGSGR